MIIGFDLTVWWAPFLAFAAGIVAFASPCVLPLVPGYLSFVTAAGEGRSHPPEVARRRSSVLPMLLFVAGFSLVFTALGAFAGVLVPIVRSSVGQRIAGAVVLVVGIFLLVYALGVGSAALYREGRPLLARVRPGRATAFPLGMAFAAGWTPCIGPVLAGTLALAATQSDPARSALLLFAFSMGLGVPFVLIVVGALIVSGAWVRVLSPLLRLVNSFEPPI
jgi:cytochrome c-type biogenesis protein